MERSIYVGLLVFGVGLCAASSYAETPSSETLNHIESVQKQSKHWAFQPIQPVQPPQVDLEAWINNDIDRFVLERLEQEGIAPSPLADRRTLIRRLYLDLLGLPPQPEDVAAFVADLDPQAYETLVDQLLDSPHYGERWGRHWLDQARYADSHGYDLDQPRPHAWRYRHWVVEALNRDLPFDQFTIEQLAGDLLPNPTNDQLVATGFHRNTLSNLEVGADPHEDRVRQTFDRTDTTATVWLGLTLGCARCHDHKYDPISQVDYFGMYAFFDSVQERDCPAPLPEETVGYPEKKALFDQQYEQILATRHNYEQHIASDRAKHWAATLPKIESAKWEPLKPYYLSASKGEDLTLQEDLSILASGPTPEDSTYTIVATSKLPIITGLRLEVLPHASLPNQGPGRDPNGEFDLSEFIVEAEPVPAEDIAIDTPTLPPAERLELLHPVASHARHDRPFRGAIYTRPGSGGWSIGQRTGERHVAVVEFRKPVANSAGTRFTITMRQGTGGWFQLIGCFRLSVTGTSLPFRVEEIKGRAADFLAVPTAQRMEEHNRVILDYFCSRDPDWLNIDNAVQTRLRLEPKNPDDTLAQTIAESKELRETRLFERGDFLRPAEVVHRATPEVLPPLKSREERPDRLDLARWIVDPANPLTARVAVNRIWQQYFGRGLVFTEDDFGLEGDQPSHPELLDWLANEFIAGGWSMKRLHKLIVTSATYQQSSKYRSDLVDSDPLNELLARQQRLRVDAEVVRDLGLAVSGLLDRRVGGPSVVLPQPTGAQDLSFNRSQPLTPSWGDGLFRRGIYTWFQRTAPYPGLMIFDAAHNNTTCTRRHRSTTPMQALHRMNDAFNFECAKALGQRLVGELPPREMDSVRVYDRMNRLYELCLSRNPREDEWPELIGLYEEHRGFYDANPQLAGEVAINMKVDLTNREAISEIATWVVLSRIVINLDEFIVRQ
ncbi:MAG: DUF1549 domain-containing protein [Planctomycetales bacterium]|nr:DUF1549 domain-containing protein [Planctomycetales bacterium]